MRSDNGSPLLLLTHSLNCCPLIKHQITYIAYVNQSIMFTRNDWQVQTTGNKLTLNAASVQIWRERYIDFDDINNNSNDTVGPGHCSILYQRPMNGGPLYSHPQKRHLDTETRLHFSNFTENKRTHF